MMPPIYNARSAAEVESCLDACFERPEEAAATGQQAREWVLRYHDCDVLAVQLESLYRGIVRNTAVGNDAREVLV